MDANTRELAGKIHARLNRPGNFARSPAFHC